MTTRAGLDTSTPTVNTVPQYTYAETLRELETLGVIFEDDKAPRPKSTLEVFRSGAAPHAIKLLAMYDQEMLHRIMTAVRLTHEQARVIWRDTLGRINGRDMTTRGKNASIIELDRIMPQFERLISINPIDAAILNTGKYRDNSRAFQNLLRATYIETQTGIKPGDANYNLVQANLIHLTLTRHKKYDPDAVHPYLDANRDDITYIAEHVDETLRLLPELYGRKLASADAIETLINVKPVLAEGAL